MSKIIFIHGPIATGKSTISKTLLERLPDYTFVNRAHFKDISKNLGKSKSKEISNETSLEMIKKSVTLNKNILVQEMSLNKVESKINLTNYDVYSFYLECSLDVTITRDKLRQKKTGNLDHIKRIYNKSKPETNDIIINTEKLSINDSVDFIISYVG